MAEYVPTKRRTTILGSLQASYSVGYLVAALLAGAILPKLWMETSILLFYCTCYFSHLYPSKDTRT